MGKIFGNFLLIIFLVGGIFSIWLFYPVWMELIFEVDKGDRIGILGTFGDSFGALNTLFSGLAFSGIIVSIFLQSRELSETRKEIKAQGEQFLQQTNALKKQVFETTLFQLLSLHNELLGSIRVAIRYGDESYVGREAIKSLYLDKYKEGAFLYEITPALKEDERPENSNEYYLYFFEVYGDQIGHYFRNIYQILKFIDKSDVDDKKFYSNLLRAQMSSYELGLLFFNCLSDLGCEKFKPLLEKYAFFEHLSLLPDMYKEDIKRYDVSVYGTTNTDFIELHNEPMQCDD